MGEIVVHNIQKKFGTTSVLRGISCTIRDGEFFFLLGPSGCGKSTLLRIIAGLEASDSGTITLDGKNLLDAPAHKRGIGMVFQQYALWPHMTVAQNISFGLEIQKISANDRKTRVTESLEMVQLGDLSERFPHELSGGQQQRVALARALATRPRVLLLDEPLSNLDARLRETIRRELAELHAQLKITMVYVTHDQEDALALASRIALVRAGEIVQLGTAEELYRSPNSRFVAEFMGDVNLLPRSIEGGIISNTSEAKTYLCLRPEAIVAQLERPPPEATFLSGTVNTVTYKGSFLELEVQTGSGAPVRIRSLTSSTPSTRGSELGKNTPVYLTWAEQDAVIVPREE
jgi:putative spermidine/putrescine transport system ATP-binding protein